MDLNEYQKAALGTLLEPGRMPVLYPVLGLAGETGEVVDKVKKVIRDHNGDYSPERRREIATELGDVLWYAAVLAKDLGYELEEVARMNIEKIYRRKHNGTIHGEGDAR